MKKMIVFLICAGLAASADDKKGGAAYVNTYAPGAAAVSRSVEAKLRDWITAQDFGASGNPALDDTAPIAAAIAEITADTIHFPRGTYVVTGLTITRKLRIECASGAKFFLKANSNLPILLFSTGANGSQVLGCELDGNAANNGTPGPAGNAGIMFDGVSDCLAENNYSHDNDTAGYIINGGSRNKIARNRSGTNGNAVWVTGPSATKHVIENNVFDGDKNGISIYHPDGIPDGQTKVHGNYVARTTDTSGSALACIAVSYAPMTHVTDNTLVSCGGRGILLFNSSNSTATGNKIYGAGTVSPILDGGSGIDTDDSSNLVINDNHILASLGAGIVAVNTQRSTISHNFLALNGAWCATHGADGRCSGIALLWETGETTSYNVISGNVVYNNALYGIREDDFDSPRDPDKFLSNSYIGNVVYGHDAEDLSIVSTTSTVAGNQVPNLYGAAGFVAEDTLTRGTAYFDGTTYVRKLPVSAFKVGTGFNSGNDNGVTMGFSDTSSRARIDAAGPYTGALPLDLQDSGGLTALGGYVTLKNDKKISWKDSIGTEIPNLWLDGSNNFHVGPQIAPASAGDAVFYARGFDAFKLVKAPGGDFTIEPINDVGAGAALNIGSASKRAYIISAMNATLYSGAAAAMVSLQTADAGTFINLRGGTTKGDNYHLLFPSAAPGAANKILATTAGTYNPLAWVDLPTGTITGSGTAYAIPRFSASTAITDSILTIDGSQLSVDAGLGTMNAAGFKRLTATAGSLFISTNAYYASGWKRFAAGFPSLIYLADDGGIAFHVAATDAKDSPITWISSTFGATGDWTIPGALAMSGALTGSTNLPTLTADSIFNNNIKLAWKDSVGTTIPTLWLDGSNNFHVGVQAVPASAGDAVFYARGLDAFKLVKAPGGDFTIEPINDVGAGAALNIGSASKRAYIISAMNATLYSGAAAAMVSLQTADAGTFVNLRGGTTKGDNYHLLFPSAAPGAANKILATTAGTYNPLAWVDLPTGGITGSGTAYTIPRFSAATAITDSILTVDGSQLIIDAGTGTVNAASFEHLTETASSLLTINNAYYDSGWKRFAAGYAQRIDLMDGGGLALNVADTGAKDSAITWLTSTFDSAGNWTFPGQMAVYGSLYFFSSLIPAAGGAGSTYTLICPAGQAIKSLSTTSGVVQYAACGTP